jgi:hypothetical protein
LLDDDLPDEDLSEDDEDASELDDEPLSVLDAAGAAGSGAGAGCGSGAGAGATSTGVATAPVAPDPSAELEESPDANAGTVAGITSNMQKIRIVAIFDR